LKAGLVSIITPCYNGSKYIKETIESVLAQTYKDWEMFVIDDGSKDDSAQIVQEYAQKDSRIKLIQ
jgi:glycosyltransferase involved in cell wall biosynthesis